MNNTTVIFSNSTTTKHTEKLSTKKDGETASPKTFTVSSSSLAPRAVKNIKVKIDKSKLSAESRVQH